MPSEWESAPRPVAPIMRPELARLARLDEKPGPDLDPVQAKLVADIMPRSFFVTGPAGTGKSVLALEAIRRLRASGRRVHVTASTGIAAINVQGCTIHSWLGTNIIGSVREAKSRGPWELNQRAEHRIRACHVLVVDEVSMLTGDYVDMIDWRLRRVCMRDEPFAGKQLLFFGDFLQLPPVIKERDRVQRAFAFQAEAWERAAVQTRELTVNHRQGEDAEFSRHLYRIRFGNCDVDTVKFLRACVGRRLKKPIILYPTNAAADNTNRKKLAELPGEAREYRAELLGDPRECEKLVRSCIADERLRVKPGAQVLMIKNVYGEPGDPYFTNGERGTVRAVTDEDIQVDIETEGRERTVSATREAWSWQNADGDVVATMRQFPVKLGWAVTIHKCVAPDTLIECKKRLLPIADADLWGTVTTMSRSARFSAKVYNATRPAYRVWTRRGYELTMTPEHKMMVLGRHRWEATPAELLGPGHELRLRRGHPTYGWTGSAPGGGPMEWDSGRIDVRCQPFRLPKKMSPRLAEFLGLMVADGTVFKAGFRLAKRHRDVVDRFEALGAVLFGLPGKRSMIGNAYCIDFCSVPVAHALKVLGGLSPNDKRIPDCILAASLREQRAFLRGLFEDGGVNLKRGHFSSLGWCGSSEAMSRTVQVMLLRLGMVSTRFKANTGWRVDLYGQDAARFRDKIGFVSAKKQGMLSGAGSRHKQRGKRYETQIIDVIEGIEEVNSQSMCLVVPNGHRFLQNGFDGCNSQGMTLERMRCDIARCFAEGQAYVALSRAKNAKHLSLERAFSRGQVFASETCVDFYRKSRPRGARRARKGTKS